MKHAHMALHGDVHPAASCVSENEQQRLVSFPFFFNRDILCICCAALEEASASLRAYVRSSCTHMKLSEDFVICSHQYLKRVLEL